MKKLLILGLLVISASVHAGEQFDSYIGVQLGQAAVNAKTTSESIDLQYTLLRLGVIVDAQVALEIRSANGTNDEVDGTFTIQIERFGGVYALYHLNMGKASVYGLAGWSRGTVKATLADANTQVVDDSYSYGVGVQFRGLNIEWVQYIDTDDTDLSAVAVGYNLVFD